MSDLRHQIEMLERSKPDPKINPDACREIDAEIVRLIDRSRSWSAVQKRNVV